jgi:hypothetical protein
MDLLLFCIMVIFNLYIFISIIINSYKIMRYKYFQDYNIKYFGFAWFVAVHMKKDELKLLPPEVQNHIRRGKNIAFTLYSFYILLIIMIIIINLLNL